MREDVKTAALVLLALYLISKGKAPSSKESLGKLGPQSPKKK